MDPVQHSRHGREEFWLDDLGVFQEFEVVSGTVSDDTARSDGKQFQRPLERDEIVNASACATAREKLHTSKLRGNNM